MTDEGASQFEIGDAPLSPSMFFAPYAHLSSALLRGAAERAGSVRRVPAAEIDALVTRSVRDRLALSEPMDDRALVGRHVARVEVQREQLVVELAGAEGADAKRTLQIPWQKTIGKRRREILLPEGVPSRHVRPIRSETRATLVAAIARGRRWLTELTSDATATAETIAEREGCSVRKVNMTISLAFLAPDLVKAAIAGQLPHGMGVARLADRANGLASTRCSAFLRSKRRIRTESLPSAVSVSGKRDFAVRDKPPKMATQPQVSRLRRSRRARGPRQFGAIRREPGNLP